MAYLIQGAPAATGEIDRGSRVQTTFTPSGGITKSLKTDVFTPFQPGQGGGGAGSALNRGLN